jgi:hypothetical protein
MGPFSPFKSVVNYVIHIRPSICSSMILYFLARSLVSSRHRLISWVPLGQSPGFIRQRRRLVAADVIQHGLDDGGIITDIRHARRHGAP